jgi:TatD DNase family protein
LDYYHDAELKDLQKQSFAAHIEASIATQMPLIVHTRSSEDDVYEMLKSYKAKAEFPVIIHCFASTLDFAKKCLAIGCYISFSGIATFKNALEIQEAAKFVPLDRMLLETDSPYLAPTPHRGKVNEPSYVRLTAEHIAMLRGISLETLATATTDNFFHIFKKLKRDEI